MCITYKYKLQLYIAHTCAGYPECKWVIGHLCNIVKLIFFVLFAPYLFCHHTCNKQLVLSFEKKFFLLGLHDRATIYTFPSRWYRRLPFLCVSRYLLDIWIHLSEIPKNGPEDGSWRHNQAKRVDFYFIFFCMVLGIHCPKILCKTYIHNRKEIKRASYLKKTQLLVT